MNLRTIFLLVIPLLTLSSCTTTNGYRTVGFDVSPNGDTIVFSGEGEGGGDLYLLHLDSLSVSPITASLEYEMDPSFSPDGNRLVYVASRSSSKSVHIYSCSITGEGRHQLTEGSSIYDGQPSFSPDGKKIVFARAGLRRPYSMGGWVLDEWDIFTMNSDGSNLQRITKESYDSVYSPQFSLDGKTIYFGADQSIFRVDSSGTQPPKSLTTINYASDISRSPDGKTIVFIADHEIDYDYELWVMNTDGTHQYQLTKNHSYNHIPRYSSDNKSVFFLSDPKRSNQFELWRISYNGKDSHRIADSGLFTSPLTWKPYKP